MLNDRVPKPVPPCPGFTVQDAGATGGGDLGSPASAERAESACSFEAETDGRRSIDLRLALPSVPIRVERNLSGRTGDRRSVASDELPILLALEVVLLWRSTKDTSGDPPPASRHEPGEPTLGSAPHSLADFIINIVGYSFW
jgi:hypothetical protein